MVGKLPLNLTNQLLVRADVVPEALSNLPGGNVADQPLQRFKPSFGTCELDLQLGPFCRG
jgi:hypothetical protein